MDRKPNLKPVESNYSRPMNSESQRASKPKTSIATPVIVLGMMVAIPAKNGFNMQSFIFEIVLVCILCALVFKIVVKEKQFMISISKVSQPESFSSQNVND